MDQHADIEELVEQAMLAGAKWQRSAAHDPRVWSRQRDELTSRYLAARGQLREMSALDRVVDRLLVLAEHQNSQIIEIWQSDLAAYCGIALITLQKALRTLRENKLIDTKHGEITIHDIEALRAIQVRF